MANVTLKIFLGENKENYTNLRTTNTTQVYDVIKKVVKKTAWGGQDHGIFKFYKDKPGGIWLKPNNALVYYEIITGDELYYLKKHQILKIKLMDNSLKTNLQDISLSVQEIVENVCSKLGIPNSPEYSLGSMVQDKFKWLNPKTGIREQSITADDCVILRKKYFLTDDDIDKYDPGQLHLVYEQCKQSILSELYPCSEDQATTFAGIQAVIEQGEYSESKRKHVKVNFLLPKMHNNKKTTANLFDIWKQKGKMDVLQAKKEYISVCRKLTTYGVTLFEVKELPSAKDKKRKSIKYKDMVIGITRDAVIRIDPKNKDILTSYPLKYLKRWGCTSETKVFSFDFGTHLEDYYEVMSEDMEDISSLLSGYVEVLVKNKKGEISLTKNKKIDEKHEDWQAPDISDHLIDKIMVLSLGGYLKGIFSGPNISFMNVTDVPTSIIALDSLYKEVSLPKITKGLQTNPSVTTIIQLLTEANKNLLGFMDLLYKEMKEGKNIGKVVSFCQSVAENFSDVVNASRVYFAVQNDKNYQDAVVRLFDPLRAFIKRVEELTKPRRQEEQLTDTTFDPQLLSNFKTASSYMVGTIEKSLVDISSEDLIIEYLEKVYTESKKQESDQKFREEISILICTLGSEENKKKALQIVTKFKESYPNIVNFVKQLESSIECATLKSVIDIDTYFGELKLIQNACEEIIYSVGSKQKLKNAQKRIIDITSNVLSVALQASSVEGDIDLINDTKYILLKIEKIKNQCFPVIDNPKNMTGYRKLLRTTQKLIGFIEDLLQGKTHSIEMSLIRQLSKALLASITVLATKVTVVGKNSDPELSKQLEVFGQDFMELVRVAYLEQNEKSKQDLFVKKAKQSLGSLEKLVTQVTKVFLPKVTDTSGKTVINTCVQRLKNAVISLQRWLYEKQDEDDINILSLLNQIELINAYINSSILNNLVGDIEEQTMSREEAAKKLRETIEIFRKLCHKLPTYNEIKEVIDNSKLTVEQLNNIFIFSKKLSLVTCGGREEQEKPLLMSKQLTKPTNELIKHSYNAILKTNETENLREKVIPEILEKIDKILDGQLLLCQPQDSLPGNEHLSIIEKITKLLNSDNNSGVSNNETVRHNANKLLKSTMDVVNSAKNGSKDLVDLLKIVSEDTEQFYNSIHGLKTILNKGQFEQAEQKGKNICNIVKDTLSHTKYAHSDLRERNLLDSFSSKLSPAIEDLFEFLRESTPGISEAKNAQKQISSMIEKINNVDDLFGEREKHRNKYNILLLIKLANIAKEATSNSSNIRSKEVHKLGESLEVCAHKIVEFADAVIYLNDLSFLSFIINIVEETIALLTKSSSVEEQVLFGNKLLFLLPKFKDLISVVDEKDEKKKEKLNKTVYVIREMSDKIIHTLNDQGVGKVIHLIDFLKESINRMKQLSPSLQNTLKMTTFLQDVLSSAQSMTQNGIRVVLDPSNSFLGAQFTISCKNTEVEIDKVVESALNLSIGREQVLKLSKVIDNSIIDLDTSNVFSQMGLVEKSKNTNHSSLQENLSLTASSINEHFDNMLLHTKNTDLVSFSQLCSPLSDSVTNFVQTSKNISSLSSDEKVQQQQLEKTASILKEMKHFVSECLTFTENPEDKSQVEKIEKFINSSKKAFSELLQEKNKEEEIKNLCEQSINKINTVSNLKEGTKKSFLESKENLIEGAKKVALSSQKLLNSAKNEFGDNSVSFSDSVENMSLLVSDAISSIEQSEIKEHIKEAWKSFCKVGIDFIAKGNEIKDPKQRKTEMTKIFRELRDNLGKLVNYVFEAALGEKKCLESAEKLRKIQSSIEASLLLSEIGLTSQQNQSKNVSFSESLGQIKNKSVSLSSTLLSSQSQTSLGENVDSFTQQMEDAYQLVLSSTLEIDENKSKTELLQSFKFITINAQKLVLYAKQDKKEQNQVESLTTEFTQSFNSTFQIVSKVFSEREQVQKYVTDVIQKIEKSLQSPTSNTTDLKKVGEVCKELTTNSLKITNIWRDEPLKMQQLLSNFSDLCNVVLGFSTTNENVKGCSKAFCQSIVELLKLIRERPKVDDYDATEAISSAGDNVGIKMTELFRSFNELNTESVKVEEDDLADEVVKKLEDLFSAITNNKNSFSNLKSNVEVMKVIGKASTAILQTTETLISASINTQKELREKGRNLPKTNVYRKDPQWARGLIKTCEEVEHSSKQFCHDLFKLDLNFDVQPNELIERLIESVNLLADDSQRLVAASRAKIDLSSPSSKKLSEAGKLVANATNTLLNAVKNWAKNYKEESTKLKPFAERLKEDPELMTQMEIAKLEKDIDLEKIILRIKKERVDQLNDN